MTWGELKQELVDLSDETEIILQKDAEGNGYSPLAGVDVNAVYIPANTWSGDVYDLDWTADDACMDEEEWEEIKQRDKVLILYPIN